MESHKWHSSQLSVSFHVQATPKVNLAALIYKTVFSRISPQPSEQIIHPGSLTAMFIQMISQVMWGREWNISRDIEGVQTSEKTHATKLYNLGRFLHNDLIDKRVLYNTCIVSQLSRNKYM